MGWKTLITSVFVLVVGLGSTVLAVFGTLNNMRDRRRLIAANARIAELDHEFSKEIIKMDDLPSTRAIATELARRLRAGQVDHTTLVAAAYTLESLGILYERSLKILARARGRQWNG